MGAQGGAMRIASKQQRARLLELVELLGFALRCERYDWATVYMDTMQRVIRENTQPGYDVKRERGGVMREVITVPLERWPALYPHPDEYPDEPLFEAGLLLEVRSADGATRIVTVVSWDLATRKLVVSSE